jgi:hypothetical protein
VAPRAVPEFDQALLPSDTPLAPLATAVLHSYLALAKEMGVAVPVLDPGAEMKGGDALGIVHETAWDLFPGLRPPNG